MATSRVLLSRRFVVSRYSLFRIVVAAPLVLYAAAVRSEEPKGESPASVKGADPPPKQAELDAAFSKMLSGTTLEGSFTSTSEGFDPTKLSTEKYTLGDVKKVEGNYWLIPARIEYGEHDVTIPLVLPVRWAGDTPMIVVDNVGLPGFGTVSARVMFFADHYAGYWKHGKSGGHLFGIITHKGDKDQADAGEKKSRDSSE
jgi:hypothetical protein